MLNPVNYQNIKDALVFSLSKAPSRSELLDASAVMSGYSSHEQAAIRNNRTKLISESIWVEVSPESDDVRILAGDICLSLRWSEQNNLVISSDTDSHGFTQSVKPSHIIVATNCRYNYMEPIRLVDFRYHHDCVIMISGLAKMVILRKKIGDADVLEFSPYGEYWCDINNEQSEISFSLNKDVFDSHLDGLMSRALQLPRLITAASNVLGVTESNMREFVSGHDIAELDRRELGFWHTVHRAKELCEQSGECGAKGNHAQLSESFVDEMGAIAYPLLKCAMQRHFGELCLSAGYESNDLKALVAMAKHEFEWYMSRY